MNGFRMNWIPPDVALRNSLIERREKLAGLWSGLEDSPRLQQAVSLVHNLFPEPYYPKDKSSPNGNFGTVHAQAKVH